MLSVWERGRVGGGFVSTTWTFGLVVGSSWTGGSDRGMSFDTAAEGSSV